MFVKRLVLHVYSHDILLDLLCMHVPCMCGKKPFLASDGNPFTTPINTVIRLSPSFCTIYILYKMQDIEKMNTTILTLFLAEALSPEIIRKIVKYKKYIWHSGQNAN